MSDVLYFIHPHFITPQVLDEEGSYDDKLFIRSNRERRRRKKPSRKKEKRNKTHMGETY